MLNICIWYDETIVTKIVPYAVRILCINCGKYIGCLLDNQKIENFITTFVTNMVFQNVVLSWIIQSNQKLNFCFQHHFHSWILNVPWYNSTIFPQLQGFSLEIIL